MIKEIMEAVTIPVMAKCRIGHFAEAQILEALAVDMIDESEGKYFQLTFSISDMLKLPQRFYFLRPDVLAVDVVVCICNVAT